MAFISFSCLIAWLEHPVQYWIEVARVAHLCLSLALKRKEYSLLPLSMMLSIALIAFEIYYLKRQY
jgi:hypothetical protein